MDSIVASLGSTRSGVRDTGDRRTPLLDRKWRPDEGGEVGTGRARVPVEGDSLFGRRMGLPYADFRVAPLGRRGIVCNTQN